MQALQRWRTVRCWLNVEGWYCLRWCHTWNEWGGWMSIRKIVWGPSWRSKWVEWILLSTWHEEVLMLLWILRLLESEWLLIRVGWILACNVNQIRHEVVHKNLLLWINVSTKRHHTWRLHLKVGLASIVWCLMMIELTVVVKCMLRWCRAHVGWRRESRRQMHLHINVLELIHYKLLRLLLLSLLWLHLLSLLLIINSRLICLSLLAAFFNVLSFRRFTIFLLNDLSCIWLFHWIKVWLWWNEIGLAWRVMRNRWIDQRRRLSKLGILNHHLLLLL